MSTDRPDPTERTGSSGSSWGALLRMARPRATRANAFAALLAIGLGFAIATQVQQTNQSGLEQLREDELVRIAGGDDVFPELSAEPLAKARILANGDPVIERAPDIILGSWCGKKFRPERVAARPGWSAIPAVRDGELHEIKSPLILQPGPAALTDGLDALAGIIAEWAASR